MLPAATFDVLYLDPPFFSNADYHPHEGPSVSQPAFSDIWEGGLRQYLDWLEARLVEMHRLLRPTGTLFLHLDWHAVHYAKVLLDRLFGYANFQNEFIWYYSGGGASRQRFARKHDTILYYTKSTTRWTFHADRVRVPYKWTQGQPRADGSARDYARGKLADDVWSHHGLMPWDTENVGYPTQKPEALLHRLLSATTDPGDVVGDFLCGSGTTLVAAQRLGLRWVGADAARVALCVAAERLADALVPGCAPCPGTRARERARARFAAIDSDVGRLGVTAATLEACRAVMPGFTVESFVP